MPLYEYQCDTCGHRFEVIQKSSDAADPVCPKCGGVVHKLQSAPAFQFKGTGWYVTDYGKKDSGGGSSKDKEGGSDSKGETKSNSEKSEKNDKPADSGKSGSSSDSSSTATSTPPASTPTKTS